MAGSESAKEKTLCTAARAQAGCTGYRICCTSHTWVGAALAAMFMDARSVWGHNAHFDYVDRWVSEPASWSNSSTAYYRDIYGYGGDGNQFMTNLWTTYRSTVSAVRQPAIPEKLGAKELLNIYNNPDHGDAAGRVHTLYPAAGKCRYL